MCFLDGIMGGGIAGSLAEQAKSAPITKTAVSEKANDKLRKKGLPNYGVQEDSILTPSSVSKSMLGG